QWQVALGPGVTFVDIPDADDDELIVPMVSVVDDNTRYRVIVSTINGEVISETAVLHVIASPLAVVSPDTIMGCVGEKVRLTAVLPDGAGPADVQWQRSSNGVDWTAVPSASNLFLDLTLSASDNGRLYRVVVTNP